MALLIDGYNLLHASGILGRGIGPGRSGALAQRTVEFSGRIARRARAGNDDRRVRRPRGAAWPAAQRAASRSDGPLRRTGGDADEVIEQMILADSSPRRLTVVSSDHRLHRAARRRNAKPIDSDRWYARCCASVSTASAARPRGASQSDHPPKAKCASGCANSDSNNPSREATSNPEVRSGNPFPPGYGDDIESTDLGAAEH